MDNNLSSIKERILYLIEYHKDKKEKFFEKVGMTYGSFKGNAKNTTLNSDAVAKILSLYPNAEPTWLLTGEGNMLKNDLNKVNATQEPAVAYKTKQDILKSEKYIELLLAENERLTRELEEKQKMIDDMLNGENQ